MVTPVCGARFVGLGLTAASVDIASKKIRNHVVRLEVFLGRSSAYFTCNSGLGATGRNMDSGIGVAAYAKAAAPNVLDAGGTLSELSFRIH